MALVWNPNGEFMDPLRRAETTVTKLFEELAALGMPPGVGEALTETNERLDLAEEGTRLARVAGEGAVLTLEAFRHELAEVGRRLTAGAPARSPGAGGIAPSIDEVASVAPGSRD